MEHPLAGCWLTWQGLAYGLFAKPWNRKIEKGRGFVAAFCDGFVTHRRRKYSKMKAEKGRNGMRLLIVEDEETIARPLARCCTEGWKVELAFTAAEALAHLKEATAGCGVDRFGTAGSKRP